MPSAARTDFVSEVVLVAHRSRRRDLPPLAERLLAPKSQESRRGKKKLASARGLKRQLLRAAQSPVNLLA